jgi:hypothetical protein
MADAGAEATPKNSPQGLTKLPPTLLRPPLTGRSRAPVAARGPSSSVVMPVVTAGLAARLNVDPGHHSIVEVLEHRADDEIAAGPGERHGLDPVDGGRRRDERRRRIRRRDERGYATPNPGQNVASA